MRPLTTLPAPLLALLSTFALSPAYAQDELKIDVTTAVKCSRPTESGDEIAVHYRGSLQSNGVVFDESYKRGQPITFVLGAGKVIAGWDQGLLDMCPGERRTLTIPPDLAYGHRGFPPVIPQDATLIFETELVDIVGVEQEVLDFAPSSTMASSMPVKTATSTEETFSIATAPSVPPPSENEDVNERPPVGSEESDNKAAPIPGEDVNEDVTEKPRPDNAQTGNDELKAEPLNPPNPNGPMYSAQEGECHLLGPFALIVQGALGAVALLSLVYKRWRETPKRPWKIFFFDVSKQVFGSILTHILNLAMSMLGSVDMVNSAKKAALAAVGADTGGANSSSMQEMPNPCSFYLLNLAIDTTLGIPVLYLLLKILHVAFAYTPLARPRESIKTGHYGTPPRATWWLKQSLIYFIGLTGMKLFVYSLFKILPWLPWVGDWALKWTEGNEALQIAFSMFIFPLAMNAVQYWVIDSFIMEKQGKEGGGGAYERVQGEDGDDGDDDDLDGLESVLDEDDEVVHVKNSDGLSPPLKSAEHTAVSVGSGPSSRGGSPGESHEVEIESHEARKRR